MSEFSTYLQLGFNHIIDLNGYDHILFIIALCSIYQLRDWQKVLVLITAFTIGHSITLALATLKIIEYRTEAIEFLIPITILLTAFSNFFHKTPEPFTKPKKKGQNLRYVMALCFGLIHGMGFSNFLRSFLGREASIIKPLFAFNVGLELGQILVVTLILTVSFVAIDSLKVRKHDWNLIVSGIVAGMAILLINKAWYF